MLKKYLRGNAELFKYDKESHMLSLFGGDNAKLAKGKILVGILRQIVPECFKEAKNIKKSSAIGKKIEAYHQTDDLKSSLLDCVNIKDDGRFCINLLKIESPILELWLKNQGKLIMELPTDKDKSPTDAKSEGGGVKELGDLKIHGSYSAAAVNQGKSASGASRGSV